MPEPGEAQRPPLHTPFSNEQGVGCSRASEDGRATPRLRESDPRAPAASTSLMDR
jgi:hypothetical protein